MFSPTPSGTKNRVSLYNYLFKQRKNREEQRVRLSVTCLEDRVVPSLSANIGESPTSDVVGASVSFMGIGSMGVAPYTYSWNFGDGTSSSSQDPSHAFSSPATYTVVLTVHDSDSDSATSSKTETITASNTVTVAEVSNAMQGGTDGEFEFTRSGSTTSALTVAYSVGGTAIAGTDYTSLSGSITIAAGSATADLDVVAADNPINGPETVTVTVESGGYYVGSPSTATLNILDLEADDTSIGTLENSAATVQPPATEFGVADNAVTLTSVTQGTHGSVSESDGTITYTPDTDYTGTDSFTYTVEDGYDNTATGTIDVTDSPVLSTSTITVFVSANTATTIPILDSATDLNNETLTVTAVTQGTDGSVANNDDGTVTYTPNTDYTGTDSFTYTVEDTDDYTATGTVDVDVVAKPVALNNSASTVLNTAVTVNVLNGDYSPTGESLTVTGVSQGTDGSVTNNDDGTVTYTPNTGFTGSDSFTYTVEDTDDNTSTATINVNVGPVVTTTTDSVATSANDAVTVTVLDQVADANDETLTVTSVTQGTNGSVTLNDNGTVTYTPNSNFVGTDSFTYTVEDTGDNTATGTVNVIVNPAIAISENSATTLENTALTLTVLDQAVDAQSETLTVESVTQGTNGSVVLNDNGTVTYTPNSDFTGTDTFTYTVEDTSENTASGFVTVTVSGTTLVATNATVSTAEDTADTITVLDDTVASIGSTLTTTAVSSATNGAVVLNDNGTVTYTPTTGFIGMDSFTYTVKNSSDVYSTGTISVMVGASDMVALGALASTATNTADTVNVLNSCESFPGTTLTLASVTQGAHGSVTMNDNGTVTYTPDSEFTGTDTFTYTVQDGDGDTTTGTVTEYISTVISGGQPASLLQQMNSLAANAYFDMNQLNELKAQSLSIQQAAIYINGLLTQANAGKGPLAGNAQLTQLANTYLASLITAYQDIRITAANLTSDFKTTRNSLEGYPGLYTPPASITSYVIPVFPPLGL